MKKYVLRGCTILAAFMFFASAYAYVPTAADQSLVDAVTARAQAIIRQKGESVRGAVYAVLKKFASSTKDEKLAYVVGQSADRLAPLPPELDGLAKSMETAEPVVSPAVSPSGAADAEAANARRSLWLYYLDMRDGFAADIINLKERTCGDFRLDWARRYRDAMTQIRDEAKEQDFTYLLWLMERQFSIFHDRYLAVCSVDFENGVRLFPPVSIASVPKASIASYVQSDVWYLAARVWNGTANITSPSACTDYQATAWKPFFAPVFAAYESALGDDAPRAKATVVRARKGFEDLFAHNCIGTASR